MQLIIWLRVSLIRTVVLGINQFPLLTCGKFWKQCCRGDMSLGVVTTRMSKAGAMDLLVEALTLRILVGLVGSFSFSSSVLTPGS